MSHKLLRKKLFADPQVQGDLVLRMVAYWTMSILTIVISILIWRIFTGPARLFYTQFDDMWLRYAPAFVAATALLPLFIVDTIRLSNRFAGPLVRFRRSLKQLAAGDPVEPLRFRDGDYWQNMAIDFNTVAARLQRQAAEEDRHPQEEEEELAAV